MEASTPERRSRLRQYQVQLLERMQAAKTGPASTGRELGVMIGGRHCLLDLTQISEIVPLQALTPVPLTQPWYLGLANIRGQLTGVVELASYLHGQLPAPTASGQRDITLSPALKLHCAVRVEAVLGLRYLADMVAQDDAAHAPQWCRQQFEDSEGCRWNRLDLAQLVREPGFLQVGL
ncbi:chemotaxis protein CheW [Pseudoduganella danionis]|uniref:Chemotaxis protein CheW n=1 Tax=Pseudoduganella danionis TaxID=1890295 RepID=A0ABW9SHJ9_9BURK|nr:chemotaxis protein CheW [Pseudoduganella danionis]MTW31532.1 chemotaxis protein CheW [Pseudoduganella danionis]